MTQHRRTPLDLQETSDLVPLGNQESNAYSFVNPKRSRKAAVAIIIDAPLETEFDDVPTRDIVAIASRGTPPLGMPTSAIERAIAACDIEDPEELRRTRDFAEQALRPTVELQAPEPAAYRDPDLCSCRKMTEALASKVVMVVVAGPVTLSPAVLREETLLKGGFDLDGLEPYDGKPWAFRHCPFEGCLIDDRVAVVPSSEDMACCGTMALAVAHGRVELPEPTRIDRVAGKFTDPGRPAVLFSHCPWCAGEIVDLVIARHKRHLGV
jgi:hypothetical protein